MSMVADIQAAAQGGKRDKTQFLLALNDLFRAGTPPTKPLNGPLTGSLVVLDVAPGLNQVIEAITTAWLPWKGKTFQVEAQTGANIFTRDSLLLPRLLWPFYKGVRSNDAGTYLAFNFRTYTGPGLMDPDCTVFKIDYDAPENPSLSIRRVLDEIV